jgi:putative heme-binding domain-containing protein
MGVWAGYSYVWNDQQDDATLAPSEGIEVKLPAGVAGSVQQQPAPRTWIVPSRTDCMACHSRAANFVLGVSEPQADCEQNYGDVGMNQLAAFKQLNVIDQIPSAPPPDRRRLVNPYDASHDVDARARSYLHANCSACHVAAGGGNSRIQLNLDAARDAMQLIGVYPQHQTFGVPTALLVAPGEPQRSILYHRIARRGPGQMPPRGTHVVDEQAVQLIHDWITQLPRERKFVKAWSTEDVAPGLDQVSHGRSYENGSRAFKELGCAQCHRMAGRGGGAGPDLTSIGQKRNPHELLESILEPSKQIAPEFAATVVITSAGRSFQGRISEEDDEKIVLHTADALAAPITILKDEIEERELSSTSTMPDHLVDSLEQSEILDLVAYLIADADPRHPSFTD